MLLSSRDILLMALSSISHLFSLLHISSLFLSLSLCLSVGLCVRVMILGVLHWMDTLVFVSNTEYGRVKCNANGDTRSVFRYMQVGKYENEKERETER